MGGGRSPNTALPTNYAYQQGGWHKAVTAPKKTLTLPARTHQRPLKMTTGFPKIQSLGPSCPKAVGHPDGSVREQKPPTTLGPQAKDSPSHVPSPW